MAQAGTSVVRVTIRPSASQDAHPREAPRERKLVSTKTQERSQHFISNYPEQKPLEGPVTPNIYMAPCSCCSEISYGRENHPPREAQRNHDTTQSTSRQAPAHTPQCPLLGGSKTSQANQNQQKSEEGLPRGSEGIHRRKNNVLDLNLDNHTDTYL